MAEIQALNERTSPSQSRYRVTVWAGRETSPGVRAEWVIYGTGVPGVIGRAVRSFRCGPGKNGRFSDWTVNVEPIRADETILPAPLSVRLPRKPRKAA
jgi:hypothetical protein